MEFHKFYKKGRIHIFVAKTVIFWGNVAQNILGIPIPSFSLASILESGITLIHLYSRNKFDKQDCLFFHLILNS